MTFPVRLPVHSWGSTHAPRRALLVHGLGSNGPLMWRIATALAESGWCADAVDLRGHGTAPRTQDYTLAAYAADLAATTPPGTGSWDLVVGHSLGGAAAVLTASADPRWTSRLVLIDPAIRLDDEDREIVLISQEQAFADPSEQFVRASHPDWHEHDVELKALATQQASRWAVSQTSAQNPRWDVTAEAARLRIPAHIIGSDPAVHSIFTGALAESVLANPVFTMSVVQGAGHSPHRDRPDDTIAHLRRALA